MTELDEADIRLEMRGLYKDIGFDECVLMLCLMLTEARILAEVMGEERNEENESC